MSTKRSDKGSNLKSNKSNESNESEYNDESGSRSNQNESSETGVLQNTIRKDVIFMQQFTAACVAKLKLLKAFDDF